MTGDPCVIMRAAVDSMPHLEDLINRIARFGFSKTSIVLSTAVERSLPADYLTSNGKQEY
ncbi:Transcription regulator AsnC [Pseudomonas amygdali pv. mellea]|nr:Transcription regulator AsnC [Pseudomonas amygdali]KPX82965.1 Transcription regulator AsnC [Pseudomonas amygdali pv. mellea]